MKSVKEAFNHSFEQVGYDLEPEFTIHGIGYQGKWGKDTMSIFIKDLESVEGEMEEGESKEICNLEERIDTLESENEDLEGDVADLEGDVADLEDKNTDLEDKNTDLEARITELESEIEDLKKELDEQ